MEMRPTMAALAPLRDRVVLELGAGTGRYTVELASESRAVLAVHFSAHSLETLGTKPSDGGRAGGARGGRARGRLPPYRGRPPRSTGATRAWVWTRPTAPPPPRGPG